MIYEKSKTGKWAKSLGKFGGNCVGFFRKRTNFWIGIWPSLLICAICFLLVPLFLIAYVIESTIDWLLT